MTTSPDVTSKPAPVPATDIKKAQLAYVYQQTPLLLLYASLTTIGLTIVVRLHIDNTVLITWTLTSLAIIAFRYFLYKEYRKNPGNRTGNIWAWSLTVLVALSGITWGVGSFLLFVPHHLGSQAILFMILVGIAVIPTVIMSVYLPLLYLFLPAVTIPAGIALFTLGKDFHVYPGAFFLVLTAGMIMVGRHINNDFRDRLILDTTNRMLVRELQEQKGELERANSAKTKFLALASHDLRQPLHALSIYSDLLVRHHRTNSCPDTTDKRLNMLTDKIGSSVHTLDQLFAALLDVSRLDAQEMPKHITVFQPKEIIEQVLSDCEPAAAEKNITLTADFGDAYTASDAVLLFQLLLNLVNNAIKFTQAGSVTICCRPVSGYLQLSVKDTGIGIAPDQQKRIFEEFYQLNDNHSDNNEGLGLGLSIVKGIAELLEHPLELDS